MIAEKVKTGAPAIAIYDYLKKHHGFTGSYSTIKSYIHNLNAEKQTEATIRFETSIDIENITAKFSNGIIIVTIPKLIIPKHKVNVE